MRAGYGQKRGNLRLDTISQSRSGPHSRGDERKGDSIKLLLIVLLELILFGIVMWAILG